MAAHRPPRLSRRHAEQLLDGRAGDSDVGRLLDLARRPGDLGRPAPGEHEVLLAFDAARAPAPTPHRSEPVRVLGFRRLLAVKVLAVGAAVATVGGAAVAATNAGRDDRVQIVTAASAAPSHSTTAAPSHLTASSAPRPATSRATKPPASDRHALAPARLRLTAACLVWRNWSSTKALPPAVVRELRAHHVVVPSRPSPAEVTALIKAAGGSSKVLPYCAKILLDVCSVWPRTTFAGRPTVAPGAVCPLARRYAATGRVDTTSPVRAIPRPVPGVDAGGPPIRR